MVRTNPWYDKLAQGYLFPEIARRARSFTETHPGVELLRMGIGDTTEPLTPTIVAGLHAGVDRLAHRDTYTGYGDYEGELPLRQAIVHDYAERGAEVRPDEVFVSDGAKPDTGNIQSIFSADARVAIQDPAYPVYVDTNVIGGRAGSYDPERGLYQGFVYMPCGEDNGFFPTPPSGDVDLIYLCSPNNPTGNVATRAQLEGFVAYARAHRAIILFDAAYRDYIRDPELPTSIYQIEGARECAIEFYSLSKGAGFTGVRLGWAVVPKTLVIDDPEPGKVNRLWMRRQSTFFNGASNVVQAGALAALSPEGKRECQAMVDYYMTNASLIRSGLTQIGLTCFGGDNAPYIWLQTPGKLRSWDFFDKLLDEAHVVGTPGSGFGPSGEGYFRLSAFGRRESIQAAISSIQNNLRLD